MDKEPTVAVILPVANERGIIRDALKRLCSLGADEVIVVDALSGDGTFEIVQSEFPAARLYQTVLKDRALQMNVGAFEAKSDAFIFVHADMALPPNAVSAVRESMKRGFAGGGFKKCYSTNDWVLKIYCFFTNLFFFRIFGSLVGTNAIFVGRSAFERVGGFEQGSFMEDLVFTEKLKRSGRLAFLDNAVEVSPRRYEEKGVFRQIAKNAEILFRYKFLRQDPSNLRDIYEIQPKMEKA